LTQDKHSEYQFSSTLNTQSGTEFMYKAYSDLLIEVWIDFKLPLRKLNTINMDVLYNFWKKNKLSKDKDKHKAKD